MKTLKDVFLDGTTATNWAVGPDATANLRHYFENTGTDWTTNLDKMIREVPSARRRFEDEIDGAKDFIEQLDSKHRGDLGPDHGDWDPSKAPALVAAQVGLPQAKFVTLGVDASQADVVVSYLVYFTT